MGNPSLSPLIYLRWTNKSLVILYSGVLIDQSLFSKKTEQYIANRSSTEEFYTIVFTFFLKNQKRERNARHFSVLTVLHNLFYISQKTKEKKDCGYGENNVIGNAKKGKFSYPMESTSLKACFSMFLKRQCKPE